MHFICADAQAVTLHRGRSRAPGRLVFWRSGWHHVQILCAGEAKVCSFLLPFLTRSCFLYKAPAKARASCAKIVGCPAVPWHVMLRRRQATRRANLNDSSLEAIRNLYGSL